MSSSAADVPRGWTPVDIAPEGEGERFSIRFPRGVFDSREPERVLVRSRTKKTRLVNRGADNLKADTTAALVSSGLLSSIEPDFNPAVAFVVPAFVRPAKRKDALLYAPRGFGRQLLVLICLFLASFLAAAGVLLSVAQTPLLWVWFGASIVVAAALFLIGIGDALKP